MSTLKTKIPTDDWNNIVKKIHDRKCVPFLGAGVNIKCGDQAGLPLGADVALRLLLKMVRGQEGITDSSSRINWKKLADYRADARKALEKLTAAGGTTLDKASLESLLQSVLQILPDEQAKLAHIIIDESLDQYQDLTRVALQDLARVSLRYRRNKNLPDFVDELKEIIPDTKTNAPRLLRVLANMPFRLIVTTNYDRLMERALELFSESDLTNPDELSTRVKAQETPLSQFIWESVSKPTYEMLQQFDAADPGTSISKAVWLVELNVLIQETSLYVFGDEKLLKEQLPDRWSRVSETTPGKRPLKIHEVRLNRLVLEDSFSEVLKPHGHTYAPIVQPINGFKGTDENRIKAILAADAVNKGLVLFKLHGTFTDGAAVDETRPVITEEDYIEFLTNVGPQGENIDHLITATIKTSTLLFLGYSLEDWNFRALFKGLVEKVELSNRPVSYAIQKDPSDFWVKFWEGNNRNVNIFNMDICDFTDELETRYLAYSRQVQQVESDEQKEASALEARRKARREASGRD